MTDANLEVADEQSIDTEYDPTTAPVVSGPQQNEVKEINAVKDDHPLVQATGESALETETKNGAGEFLSDYIYEHDSAWVREWLQNEETACVRAAKLLVRMSDEYPDGWLQQSMWVNAETGETIIERDEPQAILAEYDSEAVNLREITVNRPIDQVIEAARSLGYDPTIVWDVYLSERKIITEDNGIGMTSNEFDDAFNTIFSSGSGVDGDTGGMFGVGSESSAIVHGKDGGCEVETRSRRPGNHEGFRAYSYLGGANALPGDVEDGFYGTKFNIPVVEDFDLDALQGWIEKYAEKLRVPLLYREHDAGTTPVEEEYEATNFIDDYDDPPIQIERPGEFSLVAGPDVYDNSYNSDDENTFLVSMPIERNTRYSISTLWDVVIQIHDEQQLVVSGPNRGIHREDLNSLHEDDILLPQPTGDRDRLQRDSEQKAFFNYIENEVEAEEIASVSHIAEAMQDADHPAGVIRNEEQKWTLFKKVVSYHGGYNVFDRERSFEEFVDDNEAFPDYDDDTRNKIFGLFEEVQWCNNCPKRSTKKSNRREKMLGEILAKHNPDEVYMAASTGGNFTERFKVVENTYDEVEVIVVNGASKYKTWSDRFGFKVLKEVPVTFADDDESHDYDVPSAIHDKKNKQRESSGSSGKADKIEERELKIRTSAKNSSIDVRKTINAATDRLDNGRAIGRHKKLVVFPRTHEENISDHYDMAKYTAITSASSAEWDVLQDHDNVMSYSEFVDWSTSGLIATEDGAMTAADLIEDDRMVILAYRRQTYHATVDVMADDKERLRQMFCEDIRDQFDWAVALDDYSGGYRADTVPDDDKDDTLYAVAGDGVLERTHYAFNQLDYSQRDLVGLRLTRSKWKPNSPARWRRLEGAVSKYELKARTPNWDNDSEVYHEIDDTDSYIGQIFLELHDQGVNPTDFTPEELRSQHIAGD